MDLSKKLTISVSYNWLFAVVGLCAALIAVYLLKPSWQDELMFVAPVLGGGAALIAAFNAIDARRDQTTQAKQAVSLHMAHCWMDPNMFHAKKNGREALKYFKDHPDPVAQHAWLEADAARKANLLDMLNFFEVMGTCVRLELADRDFLDRTFRSVIKEYWHLTSAYVNARRDERQNARLLREMEWLFNEWKD